MTLNRTLHKQVDSILSYFQRQGLGVRARLVTLSEVYDTDTASVRSVREAITNDINAVLVSFRATEIEESVILKTDAKLILPATGFKDGYMPKSEDEFEVVEKGVTTYWQVIKNLRVPGQSVFVLHVRRMY